jgi:hypothetical protein
MTKTQALALTDSDVERTYTILVTETKVTKHVVTEYCFGDALDHAWSDKIGDVVSHEVTNVNMTHNVADPS